MTSEFSAASLRSSPESAGREGLAPMPLLLIGVVFAIAILLRQVVPLNTDVSWLLVVCERMLDGQHLYRDIVEINPPMAAFAYLPAVALARALGIDPRHVIDAQIAVLKAKLDDDAAESEEAASVDEVHEAALIDENRQAVDGRN